MTADLTPGFADPVADAQRCFRAVLDAMARPGRIYAAGPVDPPAPLSPAAAAVLLTLVDHETKLWLDPEAGAAEPWIAFHCGARRVGDPAHAAFALALTLPDLATLPQGTHEAPEDSATVILQVVAFSAGRAFRLRGPGINGAATLTVDGLPDGFAAAWQRNHRLFPRGVDLILCAGAHLAALPRGVLIEEV